MGYFTGKPGFSDEDITEWLKQINARLSPKEQMTEEELVQTCLKVAAYQEQKKKREQRERYWAVIGEGLLFA